MTDAQLPSSSAPLELSGITFVRQHEGAPRRILDGIDWTIATHEHWLVLGANGSGKTTLLRIAAMYEHPTSGTVRVLGEELGHTDVRRLRRRVGYASAALAGQFRSELTARDVVMTAHYAALEPWWHQYTDADRARAEACLDQMGVGAFAERSLGTLSSGEQQRVFLARTLMNEPGVILLDEPSARLDLGGREQLVAALQHLATDGDTPLALVTHHVDEIPPAIEHVLLLRHGRCLAQGPIEATLTSESLSECFEMDLRVERRDNGRWTAWAA